jgi:hypothetical protein
MIKYEVGQIINHDGDTWKILGVGAFSERREMVYLHLASTTRFREQKNGPNPVQIGDWLPLHSAR